MSTESSPGSTRPTPASRWRPLAMVVIAVVAIGGPLWVRAVWDGTMALAAADEAERQGQTDRAIYDLGRALRWRAPLSSHDDEALARLLTIGESAQAQGAEGRDTALAAYREVRRGLLATRAFGIPHRSRWEHANEQIAALMAEQRTGMGLLATTEQDAAVAERERLSEPPGPKTAPAHLASLAFLTWLVAVGAFVTRGIDARGRLRPRAALRWGMAAIASLVAWTVLLALSHG